MSNNIWQIRKQSEQYHHGKTCISRVNSYIEVWKERCYEYGIPDQVERGLSKSMRVPSYKALAECILNNDLHLYGVGFQPHISHWYKVVKTEKTQKESTQMKLI